MTFAARATVAPINREVNGVNQVLHFGASVRTRESAMISPSCSTGPVVPTAMTNFVVNTGRISEGDTFWGLEAAGLVGTLLATR